MANRFEEQQEHSFLPSEFLTFDDIWKDNNFKKPTQNANQAARLNELTSQLKLNQSAQPINYFKNYERTRLVSAGSPQSNLSHFGCLSGRSSGGSPNDTSPQMDLIYCKSYAERVREEQMLRKLLLEKRERERNAWLNKRVEDSLNFERQNRVARSSFGGYGGNEQVAAWRNQENRRISGGVFGNYGGSGSQFSGGVKKQSSGTGVFLPRCYGSNNNNTAMKSSCLTTPVLGRGFQGLDGNFNVMGSGGVHSPGRTHFLDGVESDYVGKNEAAFDGETTTMGPVRFPGNYWPDQQSGH